MDKKRDEAMHRTEWCADANKFRYMRCGRRSKFLKMPGKCAGPKFLSENVGKMGTEIPGVWGGNGTKMMKCCNPEQVGRN